ncbi:MAG TPA: AI-2E family transporter [Gammaproteobacteria bacterium]|nr:AI-2E family transporter [Gammaproteobacteria bacterium]
MSETRPDRQKQSLILLLLALAALVVIIAGMRAITPILVPFLLSVFIAVACHSPMAWLTQRKVPPAFAVLIVITGLVIAFFLTALFVGSSLSDFSRSLPQYQNRLHGLTLTLMNTMQKLGMDTSSLNLENIINPAAAMHLVQTLLGGLGQVLSNTFLILLTVVFILLESSSFAAKLHAMAGDTEKSMARFRRFIIGVNHYIAIKSLVSLLTAIIVTLALMIIGVDYPVLWGFLAFLLNFIPNIGSIIAAVPAILLALIQLGMGAAGATALVYLLVNFIIGNFIEPRLLGRGIGLSTLVVFLSLIFWGWLLGPVGMLLSVPLTMSLKIALEDNEQSRWLAIWLGESPRG